MDDNEKLKIYRMMQMLHLQEIASLQAKLNGAKEQNIILQHVNNQHVAKRNLAVGFIRDAENILKDVNFETYICKSVLAELQTARMELNNYNE